MSANENKYRKAFRGKKCRALKYALEIRKFEIELYWKRAAYFWALITAAFAGYFAVLSNDINGGNFNAFIISCVGFVFSFAWFCACRGSKFWQENWENHVDMLEDKVIGPLYKCVLAKEPSKCGVKNFIVGSKAISVSKLNQICAFFVVIIWLVLAWRALPIDCAEVINFMYSHGRYIFVIALVITVVTVMCRWTLTDYSGKKTAQERVVVTKRESHIINLNDEPETSSD